MTVIVASETSCAALAPNEGEAIGIFDEELRVKVTGAQTAGAYALVSISVAPGGGPPLHAHPGPETFTVISGEFAFTARDERGVTSARGGPGTIVHTPGGAPHRFENIGSVRGELLIVVSPDSIDFLRELGAAFPPGSTPDMETMLAIHERYAVATFHGEEGARPEPEKEGAASARARALTWRFAHANGALAALLVDCAPADWRAICADTGWSVGVQAHHVATGEAAIASLVGDAAAGHPHPPMPVGKLDEINARHAQAFAGVGVAETVALLRENGESAARVYRRLNDEQLDLTATLEDGGPSVTLAEIIEHLAIGEIERHGRFIRSAIGHAAG